MENGEVFKKKEEKAKTSSDYQTEIYRVKPIRVKAVRVDPCIHTMSESSREPEMVVSAQSTVMCVVV